jgi:hypothetical protein
MTTDFQRKQPHFIEIDDLDRDAISGLYSSDITQYLKITKLTIQKYLENCIHPNGQFRKFFERFAAFTTGFVVNEALERDSTERHLQIARYFSAMSEYPPQIFIQDGGYEYTPSSIGGLASGINAVDRDHTQVVRVMDVIPIRIDIVCAATDEQQIEDLEAFVTAAFGQFQRFTCGYILHPPRNTQQPIYWEVRIPLNHTMGAKTHSSLHGDPRIQLWQVGCSMTVEFENSTYIKYNAYPRYVQERGKIQINAPEKVRIGQNTTISISDMTVPIRVYSDNTKIAIIEQNRTQYVIRPKRLGTFKMLVAFAGTERPVNGVSPLSDIPNGTIIAEKDITVVVR